MLCVSIKILLHARAKKKTEIFTGFKLSRNIYGFQIFHFYSSFSSDIMAVMGLKLSSNYMMNQAKPLPSGGVSLMTPESKLFHSHVTLAKTGNFYTHRARASRVLHALKNPCETDSTLEFHH